MRETTTIQISKKLRDELRELGRMGETYEDVIRRLVRIAKGSKSKYRDTKEEEKEKGYKWNEKGGFYSGYWNFREIPTCFICGEPLIIIRGLTSKDYVHRVWAVCRNEECRAPHLLKIPIKSIDDFLKEIDVEIEDWNHWKKIRFGE